MSIINSRVAVHSGCINELQRVILVRAMSYLDTTVDNIKKYFSNYILICEYFIIANLAIAASYYLWISWQTYKPEHALRLRGHPKLIILLTIFFFLASVTLYTLNIMEFYFVKECNVVLQDDLNHSNMLMFAKPDAKTEAEILENFISEFDIQGIELIYWKYLKYRNRI